MSTQGNWEVTEAMITFGGSFVQGLGRLFRQADAVNRGRLLVAFPEYFKEYTEIANRSPAAAPGANGQSNP